MCSTLSDGGDQLRSWEGIERRHRTSSAACLGKGLRSSPNRRQIFGKILPPGCSSVGRKIPPLLYNPHVHAHENSFIWGSFWSAVPVKICYTCTAELCEPGRALTEQALDCLVQFLGDVESPLVSPSFENGFIFHYFQGG